jgi:hypothetical protein
MAPNFLRPVFTGPVRQMDDDVSLVEPEIGADGARPEVGVPEDRVAHVVVMGRLDAVHEEAVLELAGVSEDAALADDDVAPDERPGPDLSAGADPSGPDDRSVEGSATPPRGRPGIPRHGLPAGTLGAFDSNVRRQGGPICLSHSHGAASAAKNGWNSSSDPGSVKKSEAFTGRQACTKKPPVDSGFFSAPGPLLRVPWGRQGEATGTQSLSGLNSVMRVGDLRAVLAPGCTHRPCPTGSR